MTDVVPEISVRQPPAKSLLFGGIVGQPPGVKSHCLKGLVSLVVVGWINKSFQYGSTKGKSNSGNSINLAYQD